MEWYITYRVRRRSCSLSRG